MGRRDAEAKNVADVGEGGGAMVTRAGGDRLYGAADDADDPAAGARSLSYLPFSNKRVSKLKQSSKPF